MLYIGAIFSEFCQVLISLIERVIIVKKLCVVNNVHGLLIYLLKIDSSLVDTKFMMSIDLKNKINLDDSFIELLPNYKSSTFKGFLYYLYFFYFKQWILRFKYRKYKHYGQDCLYFSTILKRDSVIIEDGDATYQASPFARSGLKNIIFPSKFKKMHGQDDFVTSIILSKPTFALDRLKQKLIPFSFKGSWVNLSYEGKCCICSIFWLEHDNCLSYFSTLNGKDILLTQPLSEDGHITEKEKIQLYKTLLSKYDIKDVYIKTHPREVTAYSDYNFKVLNLRCPAQFFEFYSVEFSTVISLFSSGINELTAERKVYAGTVMFDEISSKVGVIKERIDVT
jgi:hypothetical protein